MIKLSNGAFKTGHASITADFEVLTNGNILY